MDKPSFFGWNIVRTIGKGSSGTVYEIERDIFGTTEKAALKVFSIPEKKEDIEYLRSEGYDDIEIKQILKNTLQQISEEYRFMSELGRNSHIVNCDDFQAIKQDDGLSWIINIRMELLQPLINILKPGYDEDLVIRLGMEMCAALHELETKDIIHRDIKPDNIFVTNGGSFKLGDFGTAIKNVRLDESRAGTYNYMAPEVYQNRLYSNKSDIYSLGMTLYWLMNERRAPFLSSMKPIKSDNTSSDYLTRRLRGDIIPPPQNGSEELKRIVLKACSFDPQKRYSSASEMLIALTKCAEKKSEEKDNASIEYDPEVLKVLLSSRFKEIKYSSQLKRAETTIFFSLCMALLMVILFPFLVAKLDIHDIHSTSASVVFIILVTVGTIGIIMDSYLLLRIRRKRMNVDQIKIRTAKDEKSPSQNSKKHILKEFSRKKRIAKVDTTIPDDLLEQVLEYNVNVINKSKSDQNYR